MDFLAFILGLLGLIFGLGARNRTRKLTALELPQLVTRIAELEAQVAALSQRPAQPTSEPPRAPEATSDQAAANVPAAEPPERPISVPGTSVPVSQPTPTDDIGTPPPTDTTIPPPSPAPAGARPAQSLEERLGTRWAVWVGGLALALGGLLLVRYSIEQGLFGPGARIVLGALFSALLVGLGEVLRRSERKLPVELPAAAHVPSILTAAGTASAFATVYAAHALYGFLGPGAAFVLLGLIGVATMFAAALHGPALAGLGLAGALIVPMLISSPDPNPWALVLYLAVVAAAAYALARLRRWLWLAASVVAGCVLWGFALANPPGVAADAMQVWTSSLFAHVMLQLALCAAFMAIEPHLGTADADARPDWIATVALAAVTGLALMALGKAPFDAQWGSFAVLAMAVLAATAWRSAPAAAAAPLAGLVALGAIATWPDLKEPPSATLLAPYAADVLRLPENVSGFLVFGALITLALAAASALRLLRGRLLATPLAGLFALAATAPLLLALVIAYLRVTQFDRSIPFALVALVEAGLFYAAARQFDSAAAGPRTPATHLATGAFLAAVAAAVCLALAMVLERGYLTVAFALTATTTAIVATQMRLALLRLVVVALGVLVLGRLVWDPRIMGDGVGSLPIFNWLLLGYGVPAAAFLTAAHTLRQDRDDLASRLCDALGLVFAALLGLFQIRHLLHGGDILAPTSSHVEQGLAAFMSLAFAYVLTRLDLGRSNIVFRAASYVSAAVAVEIVLLGLGLLDNPLFNGESVKGPAVFSSLLLAYLLPGVAAVILARAARGVRPAWYVTGAAMMAILLMFGYVTLEVRHAFQGESISFLRTTDSAELWAYSAGWLLLGLAFLAYGVVRGSREARLASAALVILSVLKVFLFDLSGVTGLWRALSFICLGAVLIGIGLVYQRLIFAKPTATENPASGPESNPA